MTDDDQAVTVRVALARVREAAKRADRASREAKAAARRRDAAVLDAREKGATYNELAEALGRSRDRVTQVLAAERKRRKA
jgi:hypothetical protein